MVDFKTIVWVLDHHAGLGMRTLPPAPKGSCYACVVGATVDGMDVDSYTPYWVGTVPVAGCPAEDEPTRR
jgi:hypothetical protein